MSPAARCLLIAIDLLLLSSPGLIEQRFGAGVHPWFVATSLVIALNLALVWYWRAGTVPASTESVPVPPAGTVPVVLVGVVAVGVVLSAARSWIHEILIYPHDALRADMLVVIQHGIRRLMQGQTPYVMYDVPWQAPLPYGPVMWLPMIPAQLLHVDIRFVTILAALFVPAACAMAAVSSARRGERALAAALVALAGAVAWSPDLRHFMSIGHTPAYWPLLALFAWLVARDRWRAAAIVCGLLIVARTTMVALVPPLLIAVWFRARPRTATAAGLIAAAAAIPFLPFAIADAASLKYALFDSYLFTMKTFVWAQTTWVQHSIGITGRLIAHGWNAWVEPVQAVTMLVTWTACWRAIRAGRPPLPWIALSFFAFSLTTLWPVTYIYFDVIVLLAAAALSDTAWLRTGRLSAAWTGTLAASAAVVVALAIAMMPAAPAIDVGVGASRAHLYRGFANDERFPDRTFAWVDGTAAELLLPRRSRRDATISIVCQPYVPATRPADAVALHVALNGTVLGTVQLHEGWQTIALPAPGRAWQYGVNELTLSMSNATAPADVGDGRDTRRLSVAVDRLTVTTK